ncbi:MAG: hypothetical protein AAF447_11120 [Myxococcota bacterium]
MTRRGLGAGLGLFALVTVVTFVGAGVRAQIPGDAPPAGGAAWAEAVLRGEDAGAAPSYDAPGGATLVHAWREGSLVARFVGEASLAPAVAAAREDFLARGLDPADPALRFSVEVVLGEGPLLRGVPFLDALSLLPLNDGMVAEHAGARAWVSPEELRSSGLYDGGVVTGFPDFTFGSPVEGLVGRLARDLGVSKATLDAEGSVRRFRAVTLTDAAPYPREVPLTEEALRTAAREGAAFLMRHQLPDGRWTYVYDGASGRERALPYNLPRHAGTTYFVAQVARSQDDAAARDAARRALSWVYRTRRRQCGAHPCLEIHGTVDAGSAALTVVAASEVLLAGPDPTARALVEGLTGFLRAQQRPDGELMHEYDLEADAPIDVQHMYYSGEAAFALLRAHDALGDPANLEAARRLMAHLTGAGWDFLGSRYYYGEEHWTCIAAGEARERIDSPEAADFCRRWLEWNDGLQMDAEDHPLDAAGAYGVSAFLLPRLTPVGSRTEAFIGTYQLLAHRGEDTTVARRVVERGLGALLRWRWAPGPTHLLADPEAAQGGLPGSPVDLTVRNDFVQHAGSSWVRWSDVLKAERGE